ncbi:MAG TPA: cell wall hydrolase [Crenotrichaceae bacterium]|nr:cell wall hydrolase [Crenotrichaceae bacterium]
MTLHLKKQLLCLLPGLVLLLIIGVVAHFKGFVQIPELNPVSNSDQANQLLFEEEEVFLEALSTQEPTVLPSTVTESRQKVQQPATNHRQIVRDNFKSYVEKLSHKYQILTYYVADQAEGYKTSTYNRLSELQCMALNLYFEARGESRAGQQAVAHVVLNRANHAGFPKTVCGVVKQGGEQKRYHCQFTWWCDGLSDNPRNKRSWRQSVILAAEVLHNKTADPTHGALWYHADYVQPYWRRSMEKGPKIGKHIFYSSKKRSSRSRAS